MTSIPLGERLTRTAHHEAGHTVAAAVQHLKLRPEGLSVDARGEGLACYHKEPDDSDESRERVIVATFAGYNSEIHLCDQRGYAAPEELQIIWSPDSREARHILTRLSYLSVERTAFQIEEQLQNRSRQLIEQHWVVICAMAEALLAKEWEPVKALKSGNVWSQESTAKYLTGEEVASLLSRYGISSQQDLSS